MNIYHHPSLGITYTVIGLLSEDSRYEVYHAHAKKIGRDIVIHLLKTGNGRIYDVPKIDKVGD